jgi:hypothetical protein
MCLPSRYKVVRKPVRNRHANVSSHSGTCAANCRKTDSIKYVVSLFPPKRRRQNRPERSNQAKVPSRHRKCAMQKQRGKKNLTALASLPFKRATPPLQSTLTPLRIRTRGLFFRRSFTVLLPPPLPIAHDWCLEIHWAGQHAIIRPPKAPFRIEGRRTR